MISRSYAAKFITTVVIFWMADFVTPTFADKERGAEAPCATAFSHLAEKKFARDLAEYEAGLTIRSVSAKEFEAGWQRTAAHDLETEAAYFRQLIKDRDPQIAFLREVGFKFDYTNGHTVPTLKSMSQAYMKKMKAFVGFEQIREDQILKPARMFEIMENGKKKLIAVEVGRNPPAGAKLLTEVANGEEFLRFVADGYWPVGELRRADENHISHAFHDFGHLGAFTRNPEFMAAVSDFAKARVKEGRFDIRGDLVNGIFESLTLGKREARAVTQKSLSSVGLSSSEVSPLSFDRVFQKISSTPDTKIQDEISKAYAARNDLFDDIGGLRADGTAKLRARENRQSAGDEAQNPLLENPRAYLERALDAKSAAEKKKYYAKYLTAMDHTTRMNPQDWVRELIKKDNYAPTSSIYIYVCRSGVFEAGDAYFEAICH